MIDSSGSDRTALSLTLAMLRRDQIGRSTAAPSGAPAATRFAEILAPPPPFPWRLEDLLLKPVERWSEGDVERATSHPAFWEAGHPLRRRLVERVRDWYDHFYGDEPIEVDDDGNPILPGPSRPIPAETGSGRRQRLLSGWRRETGLFLDGLVADLPEAEARDEGFALLLEALDRLRPAAANDSPAKAPAAADGGYCLKPGGPLDQALDGAGPERLKEQLALARLRRFAQAVEAGAEAGALAPLAGRALAPLFGETLDQRRRVEVLALQHALNRLGCQGLGPGWTRLDLDGEIGPKTTAAFALAVRHLGAETTTAAIAALLGFR